MAASIAVRQSKVRFSTLTRSLLSCLLQQQKEKTEQRAAPKTTTRSSGSVGAGKAYLADGGLNPV
jgi:hypothetical protein